MPLLPKRPSAEHLRKQAKRLARDRGAQLSEAQRMLAADYGFRSWDALMRRVARVSLFAAARDGDVAAIRELLSDGANPRIGDGRETALHLAARFGPLAAVEALLAGGALEWQTDAVGKTALDVARSSRHADRAAIVALLDRPTIADPAFGAAVGAIHSGDSASLGKLLDEHPDLLHARIDEPDVYRTAPRSTYFLDPKLVWFVANNPILVDPMPTNITEIAQIMIERGVDREDLDTTLALAMSGSAAREQGLQLPLVRVLRAAGACVSADAVTTTAGHRELEILKALLADGLPMSLRLAAAVGDRAALRAHSRGASADEIDAAFGLAVINGHIDCVDVLLDLGAAIDAFLVVHRHGTALHQAAANDDVPMIELLVGRGARTDIRDTLWSGTPLDWSIHVGNAGARAALQRS